MKAFRIGLFMAQQSDYTREEQAEAELAAKELGFDLTTQWAGNDAVTQSQQLLKAIHSPEEERPFAILVQPVGTSLIRVAQEAVKKGVGWVLINRDADYIPELRACARAPVFSVTGDHDEIGRIQGRQIAALLPDGGSVLYLEGPAMSPVAQRRKAGLLQNIPANVTLRSLRSDWGKENAADAVSSWLRLTTSHQMSYQLIAAQSDTLAMGAQECLEANTSGDERLHWLSIPFLGCDGCKNTGRAWVDKGLLTGTVQVPLLTTIALHQLAQATRGEEVPDRTVTQPTSYPSLQNLAALRRP